MRSLHNNDEWNQNKKAHIVLECSFTMQCSLFLFLLENHSNQTNATIIIITPAHTEKESREHTSAQFAEERVNREKEKK